MEMTIHLTGELDHHHAEAFRRQLDAALEKLPEGGTAVLEMSGLTFMDSSGIGVLLGRYNRLGGRRMVLQSPRPEIDRLLKMSGIYSLMPKRRENA